jgi:hypothetical protein
MTMNYKILISCLGFYMYFSSFSEGMHSNSSEQHSMKIKSSQPTVGEIWNLVNHLTAEDFVEEFKKLNCFDFIKDEKEIEQLKSKISRIEERKDELPKEIDDYLITLDTHREKLNLLHETKDQIPQSQFEDKVEKREKKITSTKKWIESSQKELSNINNIKEKHILKLHNEENINLRLYEQIKIIAENPAGKILLYRLLSELRRPSREDEIFKMERGNVNIPRDHLKKIKVIIGEKWSYNIGENPGDSSLNIGRSDDMLNLHHNSIIHNPHPDSISIDVFHELLHWFQSLINTKEYSSYINAVKFEEKLEHYFKNNKHFVKAKSGFNGLPGYLWMYVEWGACRSFNEAVIRYEMAKKYPDPDFSTVIGISEMPCFVIDEMLTVMGNSHLDASDTNGNELSENLYRALGGFALRERYSVNNSNYPDDMRWNEIVEEQARNNVEQALNILNLPNELKESVRFN